MTKIISSFGKADLRGFARPPCVIVGGTQLLRQFFDEASSLADCDELWICSPFVDSDAASMMPQLSTIADRGAKLTFITSRATPLRDAWNALTPLGWRSYRFGLYEGWHAKIYLFTAKAQGWLCLTGSHNFTVSGSSLNYESGVLLVSYERDEVSDAVFAIRSELENALSQCSEVYDAVRNIHGIV